MPGKHTELDKHFVIVMTKEIKVTMGVSPDPLIVVVIKVTSFASVEMRLMVVEICHLF